MKFLCLLKSVILHHGRALGSHPFQDDGPMIHFEFFRNGFAVNRMNIELRKKAGRADLEMDRLLPLHVLNMKEGHFLKNKNPSCYDRNSDQDQEGNPLSFQLFHLSPLLSKIPDCPRMEREGRAPAGLGL